MAHPSERVWNFYERSDARSTTPSPFRRFVMICTSEKDDDVATPPPGIRPDDPTTEQPRVIVDVENPKKSEHEGLEFIDAPDATEEPHGYGHGV